MKTQVQLKHAALRTVFIVAFVAFGLHAAYGQGPGGIPATLKLWLKADAGTTLTGSAVSQWNDVSSAAVSGNFTPQNLSPLVGQTAPTYSPVAVNFNPYVSFDGATNSLISANSFNGINMFGATDNTVCQVLRFHSGGVWFKWENNTGGSIRVGFESNGNFMRGDFPCALPIAGINNGSTVNITNVHRLASFQTDATNSVFRFDGGTGFTQNISSALPFQGGTYSDKLVIGNNRMFNLPANVEIAEMIIYNSKLVPADLNKVESYLAIKYGFTLNQTTAQNYVSSNGTIAWDAAANTIYNKDITGIGRDDASALIQRQSRNNAGTDPVTIGTGTIALSNVANPNNFFVDQSFLTWGNDGANLTFNNAATKPAGIPDRVNRVWKTQSTAYVQDNTFGFEIAQITGIGAVGSLCLLFDDDGNFNDAIIVGACTAINPTGTRAEFNNVIIPAGKPYFTLAHMNVPTMATNTGPVCAGGSITLNTDSIGPSSFAWTGPASYTAAVKSPTINNITAGGVYTVAVTTTSCVVTLTTNVVVNAIPPAPSAISNSPLCEGATLNLTASTIAGATYSWVGPASYTAAVKNPSIPSATAGMSGTYSVSATVNGCTGPAGTVTVVVTPTVAPTVTVVPSSTLICVGMPISFTATATNTGTTPVYQWKLNGTNVGTNSTTYNPATISNGDAVYVVLTSNAQCAIPATVNSNTVTVTVSTFVTPTATIAASTTTLCAGTLVTFTATGTNGGTTPSYQWQVNGANVGTNSTTYTTTTLNNNDVVTVIMTSSFPCASPTTGTSNGITMTVLQNPVAAFGYSPSQPNVSNPTVSFNNQSTNSTTWDWSFGSTQQNPSYTYPGAGTYTVTLIAYNGPCTDTTTQIITVIPVGEFTVPNVFTPNGDGFNDKFKLMGTGISADNFELVIYNRWGEKVFTTTNPSEGWDGTTKGGADSADGVYSFVFTFKVIGSDEVFTKPGFVTLFRTGK